jgi:thioredoxin-like negative regulator of GroEL
MWDVTTDVAVAKVDAEEASNLASQLDVGAYPTTLWLREGKEAGAYSRSLQSQLEDLEEHITHVRAQLAHPRLETHQRINAGYMGDKVSLI